MTARFVVCLVHILLPSDSSAFDFTRILRWSLPLAVDLCSIHSICSALLSFEDDRRKRTTFVRDQVQIEEMEWTTWSVVTFEAIVAIQSARNTAERSGASDDNAETPRAGRARSLAIYQYSATERIRTKMIMPCRATPHDRLCRHGQVQQHPVPMAAHD